MKARVLVIGSSNMDMVIAVPHLPAPGETVLGGEFRQVMGGKGANQAVAAARAGAEVTFITALGDDDLGRTSADRLRSEGINLCHAIHAPDTPNGVAFILVGEGGENLIAVAAGANSALSPAHIQATETAFEDAQVVLLQLEIPMETVLATVALARSYGCKVLLNPAPMPEGGLPAELLAQVDVFTPNEGELLAMEHTTSLEEAARRALAQGPKLVVTTKGAEGAHAFTAEGEVSVPAIEVAPIDTVGAGDCFAGTLAVALAEGQQLEAALRFAVTAAGLSTTREGAMDSMPTRGEIEARLG